MSSTPLIVLLSFLAIGLGPWGQTALGAAAPHPIGQSGPGGEPAASTAPAGFFSLFGPYEIAMLIAAAGVLVAFFGRGWCRIGALPRYPRAIQPLIGFSAVLIITVLPIVLTIMAIVALGIDFEQLQSLEAPELLRLDAVVRAGWLVGVIAILVLVRLLERELPTRANRSLPPLDAPRTARDSTTLGISTWLGSWPVVTSAAIVAGLMVYLTSGSAPDPVAHDTLRQFSEARESIWVPINVGIVVLIAPIAEELQYRYLLQRTMRSMRIRPWVAIILTSALFAAMHGAIAAPHALFPLFVLSLALGWSYERSGRILTPIIVHAGFNLLNVAFFFLLINAESAVPTTSPGG